MSRTIFRIYALTFTLILLGLSGGCSTLPKLPGLGKADPKPPVPKLEPGQPTVKLKLSSAGGEPQRLRLPLEKGMLIEDALKAVGATREFHHMSLLVLRTLPDGKKMKLEIPYDKSKSGVEPAYNYALVPDDLLLVEEISLSPFDSLLDALGDPLVDRYRRT